MPVHVVMEAFCAKHVESMLELRRSCGLLSCAIIQLIAAKLILRNLVRVFPELPTAFAFN